jgi:hypothetical protein
MGYLTTGNGMLLNTFPLEDEGRFKKFERKF